MEIKDFAEYHGPALETDEARHCLMLSMLGRALSDAAYALRTWSVGAAGACAVQYPGWPIVLGEVPFASRAGVRHRLSWCGWSKPNR
jgi:hypothetical protein